MQYEKLYSDANIDKHIVASEKYNDKMEKIIGVGLNMPFESTNSAARKNMFSSQYQQKVCLVNPETPYLSTGYENLFGHHSSSFIKSDRDWIVLAKVEKFANNPGHHYYLFVMDTENNIDVIERVSYHHNTESYGFMYDNSYLDNLKIGSYIDRGDTIKKSKSFDFFDNYMSGKNLRVMYVADANTTEDAVEVSKSAAKALSRVEINVVTVLINDNDIPLNLYGDNNVYKVIPDIGEYTKRGILCGTRTERNDEAFFSQSVERLKTTMINDTTFKAEGRVVDINVYCNKKDIASSNNGIYEGQLAYYVNDNKRFCQEVIDVLKNYIDNSDYNKSHEVSVLYTKCQDIINGKQYFKDNVFSNIIMEIALYNEMPLDEGDKVTSRYGGKGVISKVIDDELMPRVDGTDDVIDLIWNQSTCVNRLNPGQLFESSINFISSNIAKCMVSELYTPEQCIDILSNYFHCLSSDYCTAFNAEIDSCIDGDELMFTISDFLTEKGDGIYTVFEPISETMTFDTLVELYGEYPWIKPVFLKVPIKNSRGQIRFVRSMKPCIVAMQYIYRMKQNSKEKHSSTSLSATNIKNLNSKSKAAKMFVRVYSNTPIRMGEMESDIFKPSNPETFIKCLFMYSVSPVGRRDVEQMLHSFDFNVELSEDAKSRSVEILNAILKTMGLKFEFKKIPIKYGNIFNQIDDSELFVYMDPNRDKLFSKMGLGMTDLALFIPIIDNESLLFTKVTDNEKLLFVKGE